MSPKEKVKKTGGARPGAGRPKGTTNKRTRALSDKLVNTGLCPAEALVRIAQQAEESGNLPLAVDAWKAVLPYVHAKPKAIEMNPDGLVALARELAAARSHTTDKPSDLGDRLDRAFQRLCEC